MTPRGGLVIVRLDTPVKLARQAAHDLLSPGIRPAETARRESAQVRVGAYISASKSYEILAGQEQNEKVMLDPVSAAAQLKLQE